MSLDWNSAATRSQLRAQRGPSQEDLAADRHEPAGDERPQGRRVTRRYLGPYQLAVRRNGKPGAIRARPAPSLRPVSSSSSTESSSRPTRPRPSVRRPRSSPIHAAPRDDGRGHARRVGGASRSPLAPRVGRRVEPWPPARRRSSRSNRPRPASHRSTSGCVHPPKPSAPRASRSTAARSVSTYE